MTAFSLATNCAALAAEEGVVGGGGPGVDLPPGVELADGGEVDAGDDDGGAAVGGGDGVGEGGDGGVGAGGLRGLGWSAVERGAVTTMLAPKLRNSWWSLLSRSA